MKRSIVVLSMMLALAGCQQAPEQATTTTSNVQNERQEAAKRLFAQAVVLLQKQNVKGAVESLEASIKVDPTDPNAYLVLGEILIKAQQYDKAVEFLDGTAKNFPNNGAVFYMLSLAHKSAGKLLPAVLAAKRSFEIFKANGDSDMAKTSAVLVEELIREGQQVENAQEAAAKQAEMKAKKQ